MKSILFTLLTPGSFFCEARWNQLSITNTKKIFLAALCCINLTTLSAQQQTWEQTQKITQALEDRYSGGFFGNSIDIDGNYAIIGSRQNSSDVQYENHLSTAGAAYIYKNEGNGWVLQQKLVPEERIDADKFGYQVAINGDYAIIASWGREEGVTSNFGAVYVFKREGEEWVQKQRLTAPVRSAENFAFNSRAIAIDSNYIVIGAYTDAGNEDDSEEVVPGGGGVYIYKRNGEIFDEIPQKILPSVREQNDNFGYSVAISGDRIIVGAYREDEDADDNEESFLDGAGSAYIFKREGEHWTQEQKIVASDRTASDRFGINVSISGDYAVVGADYNATDAEGSEESSLYRAGAAYVFYFNGDSWQQQQKITAGDREERDQFGAEIANDGDRIVVGVYLEDDDEFGENWINYAGSAYVFKRNGTEWIQERKLVADDRVDTTYGGAYFGFSVAIDSDDILIGAIYESFDASGENYLLRAGATYAFSLVCTEIEVPTVETSDAVCAGSPVTLTAVSEGNTINWYESAGATEVLHTGSEYLIESLTETTTYWVEAVTTEGCVSERIPVAATANPLPELTILTPAVETCEGSPATLEATVAEEEHLVVWYDSPDAEEWIGTGAEFITPELTETSSYWVQAYDPETHCVSERTEIVVTVLPAPVLNLETPEPSVCFGSEAELFATSPSNVIFWYANEEDEEYLYHGNLFVTPELTETTTYWVEAYNIITGCASERIEITVTINPIPDAPIAVEVQYVEEGATLADIDVDATGELTWYADVALTVVLPETTLIEEYTTYYVTQTIAGCESEATVINPEFLGLFDVTDSGFAVYPNPTAGIVKIQSKIVVTNIEVFNINGQRIISVKAANEVNISGYPSGTYVLRIILENGEILTKKVIKK